MSGRYLRGIAQDGDRLMLILDVAELLDDDVTLAPNDTVPMVEPQGAAPLGTSIDTE